MTTPTPDKDAQLKPCHHAWPNMTNSTHRKCMICGKKEHEFMSEELQKRFKELSERPPSPPVSDKDAERDILAYRGALGYSVPGWHDGKLANGETPQCGLCNARVSGLTEGDKDVGFILMDQEYLDKFYKEAIANRPSQNVFLLGMIAAYEHFSACIGTERDKRIDTTADRVRAANKDAALTPAVSGEVQVQDIYNSGTQLNLSGAILAAHPTTPSDYYGKLASHVASAIGTLKGYGHADHASTKSLQYVLDALMARYEAAKGGCDGKNN